MTFEEDSRYPELPKLAQADFGVNDRERFVGMFLRSLATTHDEEVESHRFQCQLSIGQAIRLRKELKNAIRELGKSGSST